MKENSVVVRYYRGKVGVLHSDVRNLPDDNELKCVAGELTDLYNQMLQSGSRRFDSYQDGVVTHIDFGIEINREEVRPLIVMLKGDACEIAQISFNEACEMLKVISSDIDCDEDPQQSDRTVVDEDYVEKFRREYERFAINCELSIDASELALKLGKTKVSVIPNCRKTLRLSTK